MSDSLPSIGIDFGTTNSSMAWFDPRTNRAEIIKNQGEDKTPSIVFFGEEETLVGKPADELIEDVSNDGSRRTEVFRRTITSIKRNLISPPRIALPDRGRYVRPVEVVAEILKNLKREAQEGHFHEEVGRAVVACPAEFNAIQRRKLEEGGRLAGFEEVALIEEPAAAALAYARAGLKMGEHVLVYDLGGGTFDLAVLENEEGTFRVAMEPKGIDRCGGDDFDLALYYHCEEIARERLGRPISPNGGVDLKFLRLCRRRKENLSWQERARFGNYLSSENGPVRFEHEVERETFEGLIDPYVEETLLLTRQMLDDARTRGLEPDTTVLIGGSTRVPVVERRLEETLPVAPLKFDKAEVAVALGAACYAEMLWPSSRPKPARSAEPPAPTVESEIRGIAEEEEQRRREAEVRAAEEQRRHEEEERRRERAEQARHRQQAEKAPTVLDIGPERQDRWKRKEVLGAVAAVFAGAAGVAWIVSGVALLVGIHGLNSLSLAAEVRIILLIIALIGTLGGLVGLDARQATAGYGRLGTAGFLSVFVGIALVFMGFVLLPGLITLALLSLLLVPVLAGFVLLGVATLRARVLPRWCGVALLALPFLFGLVPFGGWIVAGLVWLALGYALWSRRGTPDGQTARRTA